MAPAENQPLPGAVSNLKTYRNEQYNFQFSYPVSFSESQAKLSDPDLVVINTSNRLGQFSAGRLPIPEGQTYSQVIMADTVLSPSGRHPDEFSSYKGVTTGGRTYYYVQTELFEGILTGSYYLPRESDVLVFKFSSSGVDWTNPAFDPETDPVNQTLKQVLATVKYTN